MRISVARDLGAAVRGRRIDRGLSQGALAAHAGVSRRWLSAFEAGKGSVELSMVLRALAAVDLALHVNPVAAGDDNVTSAGLAGDADVDVDVDLDVFLSGFDEAST